MRVSVGGQTVLVEKAQELYPDYMSKLVSNNTVNADLAGKLVALGLRVEINNVFFGEDGAPSHCPVPETEDFECDDEY